MPPIEQRFFSTGIRELDTVLGGGVVEEDVLLLIGPPGSGKRAPDQHACDIGAGGLSARVTKPELDR